MGGLVFFVGGEVGFWFGLNVGGFGVFGPGVTLQNTNAKKG